MEHIINNEKIPSVPERSGNGSKKYKKSFLNNYTCFGAQERSIKDGAQPTVICSLMPPLPTVPLVKKIGAEFIGTLILMFAGTATAILNQKTNGSETLIGCATSSGLAVMIIILSTSHISDDHLNSAVTISFAALKHFPWKHVTKAFP